MLPRATVRTSFKWLQSTAKVLVRCKQTYKNSEIREALHKRYKEQIKSLKPRRAVLYVPASDEKKLKKIPFIQADCVVLDCEDGVALNRKSDARNNIVRLLPEILESSDSEICVRINSISSGIWQEDMQSLIHAKIRPPALMLPKVENWQEIDTFFSNIEPLSKHQNQSPISLIIFVESAQGLVNLKEIIESTITYSATSQLRFEGIVFGSDDYCASIGVERSENSNELLYARQKIVAHAKAFDLQVIDMVYINYKDDQGLRAQSLEGSAMGFTGKQVIHPAQVPIVQEAFFPSTKKVEWARELIKAFEKHQEEGKGAFNFHGKMIDMPLLKQAQSIVQMTESLHDTISK